MKIKKNKFWTKNELFGCFSGCDFKITIAIFGISTLEFINNNFSATAMNILVYNLISLPQVTRLLLEDAIISSKTEIVMVARMRIKAMVKLEIIKQC